MEILQSRLTGRMMTVSYAPILYQDEPVGVILGLYLAEDYLKSMLSASYFDTPADGLLCPGWNCDRLIYCRTLRRAPSGCSV